MNQEIAVEVKHLHKTFKLPHEKQSSIKGALISRFKGGKRSYELQQVLKDISFTINKGEFFGIVGRNGSGKSTLLKLLAGTYSPTDGIVHVNGTLTPFIELGVGFNPELTGRENVYLNGSLLGFNRTEMDKMYEDIVAFAELERFMDQKLKNYSSGMQVRLAFSIAIRAQSDILLLDEVLAVGDEAFQRKCYEYFEDLKRNRKTVILVTHDMSAVEKFCDRAILIDGGNIIQQGSAEVVAHAYSALFNPPAETVAEEPAPVIEQVTRWGDRQYSFGKVEVAMENPALYGLAIQIKSQVTCKQPMAGEMLVAYAVKDAMGQKLFGDKVATKELAAMSKGDKSQLTFTFANILTKGKYFIDLSIYSVEDGEFVDCWVDCAKFRTDTKGVEGYPIVMQSGMEFVKP